MDGYKLQTLQGPRGLRVKLPKLQRPPSLPTGKRAYKPLPIDEGGITGGPGMPPDGFLGPYNSITEWYVYWALSVIFNNPTNPRQGPNFEGGWPDWTYQKAWGGGRNMPGGSVIDFVVYNPGPAMMTIAIRVVTEYWHIFAPADKHASDDEQRYILEQNFVLADVYDNDFINDPTGQAAILTLKNACGMLERPNPNWIGTAIRGSRMDVIGGYF